eukprot:Plantae.Rhodophyta-Hildenbrandia_rubra.ctg10133.p1 GENE.Plantae.Rhodophyta-Hildenbrandia_rubra.ctg10133~~Plantae.Rhodophyta-Hildenbrandia_rubra.ctg10133.p1  ORF type:complete len:520 (-),score=166.96 Plantae.Rhodophyta-Hildenbrandia_rubra.ctg10133:1531-3090(-)
MTKTISIVSVTLFSLLSLTLASTESAVTVLNKENFDEIISKEKLVLVKFYAPWCGHCKAMKEDFEKAAEELKGKAVLADLDATVEKELAEKHGVKGFPTLKLFGDGELLSDYKGGRDKKSLVSYIERASLPSISELGSKDEVDKFVEENKEKIVFIGVALEEQKSKFKGLSMTMRDNLPDDLVFCTVEDAGFLKGVKEGLKKDQVVVVRDDGTVGVFLNEKDDDLESFVKTNSVPLYGELTRDNAAIYTELPHPIYVLFQDPKSKREDLEADAIEMAKNHRGSGKIAFCWVNEVELKSFKEYVGLKDKDPAVLIYSFKTDVKYLMSEEYTKEAAVKFVQDFVDDKLKPTMKSAPVPETNDEPVKVVVGETWSKIVADESKDVLIEQYAPWCGHCKRLAPILDELAKDLESVETLVIAKMDATANDAPQDFKAKGFPTMHFFPAGGKDPIPYDGGRDKKAFLEFFQKHATHKFEVPEAVKEEKKEDKEDAGEKDAETEKKEDVTEEKKEEGDKAEEKEEL